MTNGAILPIIPMSDEHKIHIAKGVRFLQRVCYNLAQSKGFHERWRSPLEAMALVTSEVGEAVEAVRKIASPYEPDYKPELGSYNDDVNNHLSEHIGNDGYSAYAEELADIVIRVMDEADDRNIDLAGAILSKLDYNMSRPHKHGKKA